MHRILGTIYLKLKEIFYKGNKESIESSRVAISVLVLWLLWILTLIIILTMTREVYLVRL